MSAPSPASSSTSAHSTSPVPPPTPLTPASTHAVSFAVPSEHHFAYDPLHQDPIAPQGVQPPVVGPVRRKPSRRANTAERRATHNAVERQRRETLNGRFLDLAALLPNLASVRRPSKSAIVNSSIALIHTQRRARSTAARELRILKLEADALRAEVNEWRERAGMGLPRIDEPVRSREFEELVSGGLEEAEEGLLEEERRALEIVKEGLRMDCAMGGGDMIMGANPNFGYNGAVYAGLAEEDDDDSSDGQPTSARLRNGGNGVPSLPMPMPIPRQTSLNTNPMIFDPSAALLQSHTTHQSGINPYPTYDLSGAPQIGLGLGGNLSATKQQAAWNNQVFTHNNSYGMYTPPSAGFLGGFGLRDDDSTDSSSNASGSVPDIGGFMALPGLTTHCNRSNGAINASAKQHAGSSTPPSSAPASATTYAEANSAAGDAFAAAYSAAFPMTASTGRVAGGGTTYGAAMGLFM